jgi:metallo-beta-lactamase family protein
MGSADRGTLTFDGAAGTVTGSRYDLNLGEGRLLVDAGLFQGLKRLRLKNWEAPSFSPGSVNAVLLTHAHLDHSGYLPRLVKLGYDGPIYATAATAELTRVVLADAAHLQEEDAKYANRKKFSKHHPAKPLFDAADAERACRLLKTVKFDEWTEVERGVRARWTNTGHLLGAAMIEVEPESVGKRLLFSGDVGRYDYPLHVDPKPRPECDLLVIESTYGDRKHSQEPVEDQLAAPLKETFDRGGTVLIPAFALGRTQVVTLLLRRLMKSGRIPEVPIHIDSPMAIDATGIYSKHLDLTNLEADVFADGREKLFPDNVELVRSTEGSKRLNQLDGPRVVIAGSGMMTGGRILHHLKSRLGNPDNLVCMVGYQAEGTRGRDLLRGKDRLRIHGQDVAVKARMVVLNGLSGHADADELIRWYSTCDVAPGATFVTHGEPKAAEALAERLRKVHRGWVGVPGLGEVFAVSRP